MVPCAISGSRSLPRSLVNVIMIVIWVIIAGLVGVVIGVITDHHVISPGHRWTDRDLGLIVARLRPRALIVMLAVLVSSHEPLEQRPRRLLLLLKLLLPGLVLLLKLLLLPGLVLRLGLLLRLARGVRLFHVHIPDDGDRSRLHLLLRRCAPAPRRLVLRALA